jgi:hypothetical protein
MRLPNFRGLGVGPLFYYSAHLIYSDYRILLVPFSHFVPLNRTRASICTEIHSSRNVSILHLLFRKGVICGFYKGLKPITGQNPPKIPKSAYDPARSLSSIANISQNFATFRLQRCMRTNETWKFLGIHQGLWEKGLFLLETPKKSLHHKVIY